jgi:hypothetical protein
MGIDFDHTAEAPADAVLSVADAIRSSCRLAPLTEEQKLLRRAEMEVWHEEQQRLAEQRRADRERQRAEVEAIARAEVAAEIAESNRKARLQRSAEIERQARELELRDLRMRVTQQSMWQQNVDRAAYSAARQQYTNTLIGELDAMINPPPPQLEPDDDQL